ncbi:MAG: hypothetical protein WBP81_38825 [Solirubrobacteraceae bacterium]
MEDEIFPSTRSTNYVQTEWAQGWGFAEFGFGEAARILTEQRPAMRATVDQIGLAVFYLQRHRVELLLKQALIDFFDEPCRTLKAGHDLAELWHLLKGHVPDSSNWDTLQREHGDFVSVMHEADKRSFSYRYPTDKSGLDSQRADFIDLDALQRHTERFADDIHGYLDRLSESGPAT